MQAHVVPGGGGAVFAGTGDGNFEFARQKRKFGVQAAPLAHDFRKGARVGHLVSGNAGALVAGDVADAVATGLDAVHVHRGQQIHHLGTACQRNPIELDVLPGGEVGGARDQARCRANRVLLALGLGQQGGVGLVKLTGDAGQDPKLCRRHLTIRHGHAQHGCVALHIPAVLQAQGAKSLVTQLAGQVPGQLVSVLGGAIAHKLAVKVGVGVHAVQGAGPIH